MSVKAVKTLTEDRVVVVAVVAAEVLVVVVVVVLVGSATSKPGSEQARWEHLLLETRRLILKHSQRCTRACSK
jgi:hypothetical protein